MTSSRHHSRVVTAQPAQRWEDIVRRYGGEVGRLILEHDWATSPLGPIAAWPATLRDVATLCVTSRYPLVVMWGPQLAMIYNDAYVPILGEAKHRYALGTPMEEVWPEIREDIRPFVDHVMSGGGPVSMEDLKLLLDRQGYSEEVYITFSYSPIIDPDQEGVGGIFAALTETTRHVLHERRMTVLTRLVSELAELPSAEEICAVTGEILESNSSDHPVAAVYPVSRGALVPAGGHASDDRRAWLAAAAEQAARTRQVVTRKTEVHLGEADTPHADTTADGEGATVYAVHALPLHLSGVSGPGAVLVVGRNAQRGWDGGYESYLKVAAQHVSAALSGVRELETERARRKALQQLDAEKSLFFSNVSHELRTPLTLIQGPVDGMLEDPATPPLIREQLELVGRNVARLGRMVDAMLDFSRIEAGGIRTEPTATDVTSVTRSLGSAFEAAFAEAGLDFTIDCSRLPREVVLDPNLYERIVLNLLGNALKYTPEGSVQLRLQDRGDHFEVAVSDTGIGIAPEDQDRIFGRFEQLPKHPRARSHEGAGIGLAMVKQLTELLGGAVAVQSEVERGSTFTVSLPYGSSAVGSAPTEAEDAERRRVSRRNTASFLAEAGTWRVLEVAGVPTPSHGPAPASERPRLLVADDNADMRTYLRAVLCDDYVVDLLADGRTALDRIRSEQPDIVLADVMMPGLDGFALVRELRSDPRTADLPVILLSARADEEATTEGLEHGADDYVVKPFSVPELRARLAGNLERARSRSRDAAWRRAVSDSLQDAVAIADSSGRIIEVNDAFTQLLGWDLSDGPIEMPHPWWPPEEADPDGFARVRDVLTDVPPGEPFSAELELRTRAGRPVWVRAAGREVDASAVGPGFVVVTLRDVTRRHDARSRREAAARLSAEFGRAEDLDQVLAAAVAGFSELFDGDSTVSVLVGRQEHFFTASGPRSPAALGADVLEGLAGDPAAAPLQGPVVGLLVAPKSDTAQCRTWIQFPTPREIGADERIVGDLLAQAFALAVDQVVSASDFADREANLERAIESHRHIGQAIGILVERHRITPAEAFVRLKRASQDRNIKLRELASRVIETGAEPSEAE